MSHLGMSDSFKIVSTCIQILSIITIFTIGHFFQAISDWVRSILFGNKIGKNIISYFIRLHKNDKVAISRYLHKIKVTREVYYMRGRNPPRNLIVVANMIQSVSLNLLSAIFITRALFWEVLLMPIRTISLALFVIEWDTFIHDFTIIIRVYLGNRKKMCYSDDADCKCMYNTKKITE